MICFQRACAASQSLTCSARKLTKRISANLQVHGPNMVPVFCTAKSEATHFGETSTSVKHLRIL